MTKTKCNYHNYKEIQICNCLATNSRRQNNNVNTQAANNANNSVTSESAEDTTSSPMVQSNTSQQLTRNENGTNNNSSTGEFYQKLCASFIEIIISLSHIKKKKKKCYLKYTIHGTTEDYTYLHPRSVFTLHI